MYNTQRVILLRFSNTLFALKNSKRGDNNMPITTHEQYCKMLKSAYKNKYAYPAVNIASIEAANAALTGFAEAKSDGIIQISIGGGEHASGQSRENYSRTQRKYFKPQSLFRSLYSRFEFENRIFSLLFSSISAFTTSSNVLFK